MRYYDYVFDFFLTGELISLLTIAVGPSCADSAVVVVFNQMKH